MKKLKTTAVLQSRAKNTTLSVPKKQLQPTGPLNQKKRWKSKSKAEFHYPAWDASPSFVTISYQQIAQSGYKVLTSFICVKTSKYNEVTPLHHVGG